MRSRYAADEEAVKDKAEAGGMKAEACGDEGCAPWDAREREAWMQHDWLPVRRYARHPEGADCRGDPPQRDGFRSDRPTKVMLPGQTIKQ